jgi:hypothetical protein
VMRDAKEDCYYILMLRSVIDKKDATGLFI